MLKRLILLFSIFILLVASAATAQAQGIILSTTAAETLGGLSFKNGDLVEYDPITDIASLFFSESLFSTAANIDAVDILSNGNFILSTNKRETLGGLTFNRRDLIEYDPIADSAILFFNGAAFGEKANIDAVNVLDNGNIILSTTAPETLGGLSFKNGDLIEYDPITDIASLFLSESLFSSGANIDAVDILSNGNIVLSTNHRETLGGLTFNRRDLIEYNPITDIATLFFDGSAFGEKANIDAAYIDPIPEPVTMLLLGGGLLGLAGARFRRKK